MKSPDKNGTIPSIILITGTRYLVPVLLLFSIFLFARGHNEPGGGFVAGLVGSVAFALYAIADSVQSARRLLRFQPRQLIGAGLLIAASSAILPVLFQKPFMTGLWSNLALPVIGTFGTPLLFDAGVFITVLGVVLQIVFALMEE
jgi:multicomponent Na+:H+ antiporter subunit B